MTINVTRTKDMKPLEANIIKALYDKVKNTPKDGQWREFKGTVRVKGRPYSLVCIFRLDGMFLKIRKSEVKSDNNSKLLLPSYYNS